MLTSLPRLTRRASGGASARRVLAILIIGAAMFVGTGRWLLGAPAPRAPRAPRDFRVKTDNAPQAEIAGRVFYASTRTGAARGTMIVCHGWHTSKEAGYGYNWVCRDPAWNMICFDFREHGQSTHTRHLSSLGYHEIWDVKAVVDYCEQQGLEKPYVIYGTSMGASVGLRWAARDDRIAGVFACSPFRNALRGSQQFIDDRLHAPLPTPFLLDRGFAMMLDQVDLPQALISSKRATPLRLTILCGERDIFPPSDQRQTLAACKSPRDMKHLYVLPGLGHRWLWSWKGNPSIPSHDKLLTDFLNACEREVNQARFR
jgi:pimeloyl-ACP methyl ester carboxylesterase